MDEKTAAGRAARAALRLHGWLLAVREDTPGWGQQMNGGWGRPDQAAALVQKFLPTLRLIVEKLQSSDQSNRPTNDDLTQAPGMTWPEAAERMKRIRDQGKPWKSLRIIADEFGCSPSTINKAIEKTPELHTWAKHQATAAPRAQSVNDVVTDRTAQSKEPNPEDDAAVREFIENADPQTKVWFFALSSAQQLEVVNDPDRHHRILGRRP